MKKVFCRKLIRDNAPQKMREAGVTFETRQLGEAEFKIELVKKVVEEATELGIAKSKKAMVAELADILDVIDEIKRMFGVTEPELRAARTVNADEKGAFQDRLFLEWSQDSG